MSRTGLVIYLIACDGHGSFMVIVHADRTVQARCNFTGLEWTDAQPMERGMAATIIRVWRAFARKDPTIHVERYTER